MTVTNLRWTEAMDSVRGSRKGANPNFGFQRQLQNYEKNELTREKAHLLSEFGKPFNLSDHHFALKQLEAYHERQALELHVKQNDSSHNIAVKSNGEKNYTLPYNAYNLDEKKMIASSSQTHRQLLAEKPKEKELDSRELEKFFKE